MSKERPPEWLPEWLPDGWIMEVRRGDNGRIYRYYIAPMTGCTFRTKAGVLQYLLSMVDGRPLETRESYEDERQLLAPPAHSLFEQLPSGWIIEIRADYTKLEKMYKCYVDPYSGSRFLSKEDVLCYLKEGCLWSPTSKQIELYDTDSDDNVLAQIEFAPEGLPYGWIKETKFRFCIERGVFRKDSYYTDPLSGYVFQSLKDAIRYIETGEISKYAHMPMISVTEMYSFEKSADLPPFVARRLESVRRRLFERHTPSSVGELVIKKEDMSSDETSFHCGQDGTFIWFPPPVELEERNKRRKMWKHSTKETMLISKPSVFKMLGPAEYSQTSADAAAQIKIKQEEEREELVEAEKSSTKISGPWKEKQPHSYLFEQRDGLAHDMKCLSADGEQAMLENKETLSLGEEQLPLAALFKRKKTRKPKAERTNSPPCQTSARLIGLEARPGDESVPDCQHGAVRSSNARNVACVQEKGAEARECPESKEPPELAVGGDLVGAGEQIVQQAESSPALPHSNLELIQYTGPDFKYLLGDDLVVEDWQLTAVHKRTSALWTSSGALDVDEAGV